MRFAVARTLAPPVLSLLIQLIWGRRRTKSCEEALEHARSRTYGMGFSRRGGEIIARKSAAGRGSALAAVVARGEAGLPSEEPREMAGVGVADFEGHVHHAHLRLA